MPAVTTRLVRHDRRVVDLACSSLRVVLGVLALAAATTALARLAGLRTGMHHLTALLRAGLQLAVVAAVLAGALREPWLVVLSLALVLAAACGTAVRRLRRLWRGGRTAVAAVCAGAAAGTGGVFALQLLAAEPRYLLAVGGIVAGNAMTAATLAGRAFLRGAHARRDEVEAAVALGASFVRAHRSVARDAAHDALVPHLDQTRATGIVTLPGAFVGALFAGASPAEAAEFQLVVLAAIGLASTVTAVVVTRLASRTPYLTVEGPD